MSGISGVVVAGLCGIALGAGAVAAGVGDEHARVAAAAGSIDVAGLVELPSGRSVYLECRGEGSPTVILESGGGLAASQWDVLAPGSPLTPVFPAVAEFTRVCAYDRPGTIQVPDGSASRSDPVPLPRPFADMVTELQELLDAAGVPGPYVLAAHSMGGAVARLFAAQHPEEVVGFVSLDAANATIYQSLLDLVGPGCCDIPGVEFRAEEAMADLRAAPSMPRVPTVVVAHSQDRQRFPNPLGWPTEWPIPQLLDVWDRAQEEIAAEVPGAVFRVAADSEHNVMLDQPVLVTSAIRSVVDAVRQHGIPTGDLANTGTDLWPLAATAAAMVAFGAAMVILALASGTPRPTRRPTPTRR